MTREDVQRVLQAGASAAVLGTAFLLCPEAGTNPTHRAALTDPRFTETALTRAFTGRTARALVNRFVREHPDAPRGYPRSTTSPGRCASRQPRTATPTSSTSGPVPGGSPPGRSLPPGW